MIVIDDIEQGSPEWFIHKCGVPSASNFSKIITGEGKRSGQWWGYVEQIAAERITGVTTTGPVTKSMQDGTEKEPEARFAYEFLNCVSVREVAICFQDRKREVSCSPDGLILSPTRANSRDYSGACGLEIKCPEPKTHVHYLRLGVLPTKYVPQVQGSMWVTGLSEWVFFSYCDGFRPFQVEVERDDEYHQKLSELVDLFLADVNTVVNDVKEAA